MDRDAATHAVADQAAVGQPQGVDEGHDRPGVILDGIAEVQGLVAVAVAEEADQQRAAPAQRCPGRGRQQLARG